MSLRALPEQYNDIVQFLTIYIREADPTDGRFFGKHDIRNH